MGIMYEFHGWAVVRYSSDSDENAANMPRVLRLLRIEIAALEETFRHFQFGDPAGSVESLTVTGMLDHPNAEVIDIFRWLAENASGSYGLLYVHESDTQSVQETSGAFQVFRLARGRLDELPDPFLSPRIPSFQHVQGNLQVDNTLLGPNVRRLTGRIEKGHFADKHVEELPLLELWNAQGPVNAVKLREVAAPQILSLLQTRPFQFVVAELGKTLRWLAASECLSFWRSEVQPHLFTPSKPHVSEYPDGYLYSASEWELQGGERLVLLERYIS